MTKQKSNKIQILRGLAIIAVVCGHTIPLNLSSLFIKPVLNLSVALFLFLSGYLSSAKKWNPKKSHSSQRTNQQSPSARTIAIRSI